MILKKRRGRNWGKVYLLLILSLEYYSLFFSSSPEEVMYVKKYGRITQKMKKKNQTKPNIDLTALFLIPDFLFYLHFFFPPQTSSTSFSLSLLWASWCPQLRSFFHPYVPLLQDLRRAHSRNSRRKSNVRQSTYSLKSTFIPASEDA